MKRISLLLLVLSFLPVSSGCSPAVDVEEEKIELLRIHLADIQAHRDNDVDTLLETIPEEFIYVGQGEVTRQSRHEIRDFFTDYLAGAQYDRYEDLMVPHAEVSADGTMGWVISRMAVTRTEPGDTGNDQTRSFTYAGIMTYEKVDGKWMKVANVSTFAP
jgi:hypothetical protein